MTRMTRITSMTELRQSMILFFRVIVCAAFLLMMTELLSSCEHKDLCYHHPHQVRLRVVFDWMDAPDAAPDGMTIYFYPTDVVEGQSADPYRFDFVGREGG